MMEQVLCIKRNRLPASWVNARTALPMEMASFTRQCSKSGFAFLERALAEKDPEWKQVIPYVLLQTADGKKTAVYSRKGSESRLHDLWSVGIGGHINPQDLDSGPSDFKDILVSGMKRELEEELLCRPPHDPLFFLGIVSEDLTEVGSVHLGAVFKISTQSPEAYAPGPELHGFDWIRTADLGRLNLELWSELAMALVNPAGSAS